MEITLKEVEQVREVGAIGASEDEKAIYARQLSAILTYMDQLKALDTSG